MTALLIGVVVLSSTTTAAASAADDGQWWYDAYGVADVHAEGWTGKGVKIAAVDTQINPDLPDFQGADLTVAEGSACVGTEPTSSVASAGAQHGGSSRMRRCRRCG
ncbi:hypothetical protein [Microbacterium sp. SORGH_AS_0862]|uniref:hypothetical protein n=1 Tax=Microbacterium sp. SORGH_AS_0862 TaxID=3041789 RepID=UPI002794D831|nr:hypothetical protein [Microbacterium sp. SORGH_AS_0862]MDQ1204758.1 subtilisin family serine protease [Microbacterium sp. SORGH_AS_0862]